MAVDVEFEVAGLAVLFDFEVAAGPFVWMIAGATSRKREAGGWKSWRECCRSGERNEPRGSSARLKLCPAWLSGQTALASFGSSR